MAERAYRLSGAEKTRLTAGLEAGFTVPIIDDVEDYVWEAIFHHVKGIDIPDPITEGRTKRLFDAVTPDGRGWSLKTVVWAHREVGAPVEFVIQRADIFAKAAQLGYLSGLSATSEVEHLGAALIEHWNQKYKLDSGVQGVKDARLAILLKDVTRKKFTYIELEYPPLSPEDYTWSWSRKGGRGLKGHKDGKVRFKWYYGQKQLFEVIAIPPEAYSFALNWRRATLRDFVNKVGLTLAK